MFNAFMATWGHDSIFVKRHVTPDPFAKPSGKYRTYALTEAVEYAP
jgi:hypothetical protein